MRLKKLIKLSLFLLLSLATFIEADHKNCNKHISRSIFVPKPIIDDLTYSNSMNMFNRYFFVEDHAEGVLTDKTSTVIGKTFFYQENTRKHELAKYFSPNNNPSFTIRQDGSGDVDSLWFDVVTPLSEPYSSVASFCPRRQVIGGTWNFHIDLKKLRCGLWLDVNLAVAHVRHDLRFKETTSEPQGTTTVPGSFANVRTALTSKTRYKYGRLSLCTQKLTGIDDIDVKLGYNFVRNDKKVLAGYVDILLPTAHIPKGEFLFEPRLGYGHFALGLGFHGARKIDHEWITSRNLDVYLLTDFMWRFAFSRRENRSFDLTNGPWTRYLQANTENAVLFSQPLINYTTYAVDVKSRNSINWWIAAHWEKCDWHTEVGFNLWWREKEKACFCKSFDNITAGEAGNVSILDIGAIPAGFPTSASQAKIDQTDILPNIAPSDNVFTPLTFKQLDINSGTMLSSVTGKFYLAVARDFCFWNFNHTIGLGAGYEADFKHRGMSNGSVWLNWEVTL